MVAKRGTTLSVTVSRLVPSATNVAVINVLPRLTALTTPSALIVATPPALDVHLTPVAKPGSTVTMAVSVVLVPLLMAMLRCTMFTVSGRAGTVTALVARRVVSAVESTVTVVLPKATAVTRPVALTVAAAGLLERHVTVCATPASAAIVAVSCWVLLMNSEAVVGVTATARTTGTTFTMVVARSVVSPTETAVIVAVPSATPDTTPAADTLAMVAALVRQVTVVGSPASISTTACSACACPVPSDTAAGVTVTPRAACTVMLAVVLTRVSATEVARMMAVPIAIAVTSPVLFTVASAGDSLLHVTPVPAPLMASTTALSDCVSPRRIVATLGVTATPRTVGGFTTTGGPAESPPPPQAASASVSVMARERRRIDGRRVQDDEAECMARRE